MNPSFYRKRHTLRRVPAATTASWLWVPGKHVMNFESENRVQGRAPGVLCAAPLSALCLVPSPSWPVYSPLCAPICVEVPAAVSPQVHPVPGDRRAADAGVVVPRSRRAGGEGAGRAPGQALLSPPNQRLTSFWVPWGGSSATWGVKGKQPLSKSRPRS